MPTGQKKNLIRKRDRPFEVSDARRQYLKTMLIIFFIRHAFKDAI
jgi:hypothetical protein